MSAVRNPESQRLLLILTAALYDEESNVRRTLERTITDETVYRNKVSEYANLAAGANWYLTQAIALGFDESSASIKAILSELNRAIQDLVTALEDLNTFVTDMSAAAKALEIANELIEAGGMV